jgi:type 1 glutamine amidotransferase
MSLVLVTDSAPYGDAAAGVHHALQQAVGAFRQLARKHGLGFTHVEDVTEKFALGTVLVLFTIGDVPWSAAQRAEILERVSSGTMRVLTVHSGTDASHDWPDYALLTGGRFDGHPVSAVLPLRVDRAHPATHHLPESWDFKDELYLFRELLPGARILISMEDPPVDVGERALPFAWCHTYGAGRCFTTALGHYGSAWEDVDYVRHLDGALSWLLSA